MSSKAPSSLRLVVSLAITGLLSGLILVGVYLLTQPRILRNQAEAMRSAIFTVLPGSTNISTFVLNEDQLQPFVGGEDEMPRGPAVFAGFDDSNTLIGYAIPADGAGFMDTVKLIYGYDPQRRAIIGMQVLESRETPGLGDKILADPEFHANFVELLIDPTIVPVKKGKKTDANQVDCITGATISSEAVVSILNNSAMQWISLLEQIESITAEGKADDSTESP
jgi:electron transport complex protein RnfG